MSRPWGSRSTHEQRADRPQRLAHGVVVGALAGQHDVVAHRADEDVVLLGDQRDLGAQHLQRQVDQLDAADGWPSRSAGG